MYDEYCGYENPPYYLSAYSLAVKAGFTGTEEEWLASLIGPVGPRGPIGENAFFVHVHKSDDSFVADKTYDEILAAGPARETAEADGGHPAYCVLWWLPASGRKYVVLSLAAHDPETQRITFSRMEGNGQYWATITPTGVGVGWTQMARAEDIPSVLPNPNALTVGSQSYDGSKAVDLQLPAYCLVADSAAYDRLTAKLTADGFYLIYADQWDDFPVEIGHGAMLVFRYSPNYVLQLAVSLTSGAMQTRVVHRDTGEVFRPWKPECAGFRYLESSEPYERLTSRLVEEGFYSLEPALWDDLPVNGGCALLVFRYSLGYVLQLAVSTRTGAISTRVVSRSDYTVYRDWSASDGTKVFIILVVGDSIAYGYRNSGKGFVGDLGVPYKNCSVAGASLSTVVTKYTNIPDQLAGEEGYIPNVVIANGGVNDYYQSAPMGEIPDAVATDAAGLDRSTVLGGLQVLLLTMAEKYPDAKHYFLLSHRTLDWPDTANGAGYTQAELFEAIKTVCGLYGVEIIDVYGESCIDTAQSVYLAPDTYHNDPSLTNHHWVDADGIHPMAYGYLHGYVPIVRRALGLGGDDTVDPKTIEEIIEGYLAKNPGSSEGLPSELPNPYALTINGTAYDGSRAVSVSIPAGANGETPYIGSNGNWWIGQTDTGVKAAGEVGPAGANGYTPVRGTDYWTEEDRAAIDADIAEELAKHGQLKPEFVNSIDECTDTTKLYVLPDGYIYGYQPKEDQEEFALETVGYVEGSSSKSWHTVNTSTSGLNSGYVAIPGGYKYIKAFVKANAYMFAVIFFDSDKNPLYTPSVIGDERTDAYLVEIPTDAKYVIVSNFGSATVPHAYFYNDGVTYKWTSTGHAFVPADYEDRIVALEAECREHEDRLTSIEENGTVGEAGPDAIFDSIEFSLFKQWGLVGDSYSVGHTADSDGTASSPNMDYSWGQYLARRIGNTCLNFGASGLSAKAWMSSGNGYAKLIADGNLCQCYIIALGANDTGCTLGSMADVDFSNMDNNADTEYGWYAKVINAVRTAAPQAPIFLFTLPFPRNTDTNIQAINDMIREFAANENLPMVYLVDLDADYNDYFKSGKLYNCIGNTGWHLTALGYLYASKINEMALSKVISDNYADFQNVFTIPYSESINN